MNETTEFSSLVSDLLATDTAVTSDKKSVNFKETIDVIDEKGTVEAKNIKQPFTNIKKFNFSTDVIKEIISFALIFFILKMPLIDIIIKKLIPSLYNTQKQGLKINGVFLITLVGMICFYFIKNCLF